MDEIKGRITTNNFHDVGDMCHDLQTIGDSYFPKNKSLKVVYGERERENVTM